MHCEFKVKYTHKIFDNEVYRECLKTLLAEAANRYSIPIGEVGFAEDHLHFMADIGLYSRPEVAKLLRGYTAKKFFKCFPELKRNKWEGGLFWGSGLWNPSYYIGAPRNLENTINYIRKQKYGSKGFGIEQRTLNNFIS